MPFHWSRTGTRILCHECEEHCLSVVSSRTDHMMNSIQSWEMKKTVWKTFLITSELRQEHWSMLLKFDQTCKRSSNLKVNLGMRIGPTGGLNTRR